MKLITKYLLPAALVAGFLFCFFTVAFGKYFSLDDCFYDGLVRRFGIGGSIKVCYDVANGRWFSHIICAFSFYFFQQNALRYGIYLTFLLVLFVWGCMQLYKSYKKTFLKEPTAITEQMSFGLVFTATLYFLQFEGRWEAWGWASSANTHLMSVICCLFLFSILLKEKSNMLLSFILGAFIGGLNEMNAICSVLLILLLIFADKKYFPEIKLSTGNLFIASLSICISLLANILSGGYRLRMEGLQEFSVLQSMKNTIHSFILPVQHYQYLIFFLGALIIFMFYIRLDELRLSKNSISLLIISLAITCFSFFLHCYTLSDVVPARGALWGYTLMLFTGWIALRKKIPS